MKRIISLNFLLVLIVSCSYDADIDESFSLQESIAILASDEYGGRAPGTEGGKPVSYTHLTLPTILLV